MFKKVLIPGLAASIAILIVGMLFSILTNQLFPDLNAEYQKAGLFRPWSDPLMSIFFVYPFLLGYGLAWVWDKVKALLTGSIWQRAWVLALGYFVASTIPGMTITYSSFSVSLLMVLSWTIGGLVQVYCAGLVLSKMNS